MGIFSKLFGSRPRKTTAVEEINTIIDQFTTATIAGVDREDLGRYPPKQYKVMAFHFGAIECLADQYDLDETQTLGIFVAFINRYFNMPINETGSISERLQGFHDNPDERRYLDAGREIFLRWHKQDERRAPLELGEMLKDG
jgi:hypothetical protein